MFKKLLLIIIWVLFLSSYSFANHSPAPSPDPPAPDPPSVDAPTADPPDTNGDVGIQRYPIKCQDGIFEKCPKPKPDPELLKMLERIIEVDYDLKPVPKPVEEFDKYRPIYNPPGWKEE